LLGLGCDAIKLGNKVVKLRDCVGVTPR
jgi:hypothetical protein